MATSIQSTLSSSRLQMVPEDSMALVVGTGCPEKRESSGSIPISMIRLRFCLGWNPRNFKKGRTWSGDC